MTQKFKFNNNYCLLSFSYRVVENWEDIVLYFGFCNSIPVRIKFDKEKKIIMLDEFREIPKCLEDMLDYNNTKTLEYIKPSNRVLEVLCRGYNY